MLLGLRTIAYHAPDLAKAKQWYSDVLGVPPYFDEPFYVGFSVGGFELGLIPDAEPGITGTQAMWGVENVDAKFKRLLALGATELEAVTDVDGGIKVAAVQAPASTGTISSTFTSAILPSLT